jgi:hypothetical protein
MLIGCLALAACDGGAPGGATSNAGAAGSSSADAGAASAVACSSTADDGVVCSGGDNGVGLTAMSVNNQGLIGNSQKGRGVYGTSISSEGGYFSSTDGDGLLAYSTNGFAGHFTGGRGITIDAPLVAGAPALTANGAARLALPAAPSDAKPVCGTLDEASGLFTLGSCADLLAPLEARVAALEARLSGPGAATP